MNCIQRCGNHFANVFSSNQPPPEVVRLQTSTTRSRMSGFPTQWGLEPQILPLKHQPTKDYAITIGNKWTQFVASDETNHFTGWCNRPPSYRLVIASSTHRVLTVGSVSCVFIPFTEHGIVGFWVLCVPGYRQATLTLRGRYVRPRVIGPLK